MMEKTMGTIQWAHDMVRDDPKSTFLTNALRSDKPDTVSLPFKLIIEQTHQSTRRNMPYLRQSWNRIDFLSILCFWVSFALATGGMERGPMYIGIFRTLSVLKVSRLLAVTSGTTVSVPPPCQTLMLNGVQTIMRSLKTARPLLASVAYFVLFAMLLFSCVGSGLCGYLTLTQFNRVIGIESFKGSFRRSCVLQPTLGELEIQISDKACGGWIDPQTLGKMPYTKRDGTRGGTKGYICPIGQICKARRPFGKTRPPT